MIVGSALVLALAASAQSQTSRPASTNPEQKPGQMNMSMDDMMKQCREHCTAASKQMDDTMKKMNDAGSSNDPAKMRTALEEAHKPMMDMKSHMDECVHMMNMMQNMSGMMKKK